MRVLVACEFSGAVRDAFIKKWRNNGGVSMGNVRLELLLFVALIALLCLCATLAILKC